MAARKKAKTRRWSWEGKDGEDLPHGPQEALDLALSMLDPFRVESDGAGADRLRKQLFAGQPSGPSTPPFARQEATRLIRTTATRYNAHARLEKDAPRLKKIAEDLAHIEVAADTLRRSLADLDDLTRSALQQSQSLLRHALHVRSDALAALYELANGAGLPMPAPHPKMAGPYWIDQLANLSQYAGAIAGALAETWGGGDPDRVDRGGTGNTYRKLYGSPKWRLVCSAWAMFDVNHPGQATGKEGDPLYQLASAIYEYGTGQPGDETTGLDWCVKHAAAVSDAARRQLKTETKQPNGALGSAQPTSDRSRGVARITREANDLMTVYRGLAFELYYAAP